MFCNFLSRTFETAFLTGNNYIYSNRKNYIYSNREEFKSIKKDLHLTSHFFVITFTKKKFI